MPAARVHTEANTSVSFHPWPGPVDICRLPDLTGNTFIKLKRRLLASVWPRTISTFPTQNLWHISGSDLDQGRTRTRKRGITGALLYDQVPKKLHAESRIHRSRVSDEWGCQAGEHSSDYPTVQPTRGGLNFHRGSRERAQTSCTTVCTFLNSCTSSLSVSDAPKTIRRTGMLTWAGRRSLLWRERVICSVLPR